MLKHFDKDITSIAFLYAHCGVKEDRGNRVYSVTASIINPGQASLEFHELVGYLAFTGRERFYSNLTKQQLACAADSKDVSNRLKVFLKEQPFVFSLNDRKDLEVVKRFSGVGRIIDLNLAAEYFLPDLQSHSFKALWEYVFEMRRDRIHFTGRELVSLSIELVKHICGVRLNDTQFPQACAIRYYLAKSKTLFGTGFLHAAKSFTEYFGGLFSPYSAENTNDWKQFLSKPKPKTEQDQKSDPYKKISASDMADRYRTLSEVQAGFQYRPSQTKFAQHVVEGINGNSVLCIEAGTGTGKTLGYLIPAMDFLMRNENARVAISTYTKTLQEQVFQREVAFVKEHFKAYRDIPVSVLKGKSSYLCVRKLDYALEVGEKGAQLLTWLYLINICYHFEKADVGSIGNTVKTYLNEDSLLTHILRTASAREGCPPSHRTCPAQVVTARARDARMIITNHHKLALLEKDILLSGLFRNYIVDEANHFERAVRNAWKEEIDSRDISMSLAYLKITFGKILIRASSESSDLLIDALTSIGSLSTAFDQLRYALRSINPTLRPGEEKSLPLSDNRFKEGHIRQHLRDMLDAISRINDGLESLLDEDRCRILKIVSRTIAKIANAHSLLESFLGSISLFEKSIEVKNRVFSYKLFKNHFLLIAATIDVGEIIRDHVYESSDWVVYTAATLRYKNSFECFRRIVGLKWPLIANKEVESRPKKILLREVPSPFPAEAMEIVVPNDAIPGNFSNKKLWLDYIVRMVPYLIKRNKGRTLVLFSSYSDLAYVSKKVSGDIEEAMYPLLVQEPGQSTINLCESFLAIKESVLFGVDTFWYGVDFKGDTLTQVIITRVPYQSAMNPLQTAKKIMMDTSEFWERYHYDMNTKLKQGIGRLIRSHTDKGKVVVLDSRLANQEYGAKYVTFGKTSTKSVDKQVASHDYKDSNSKLEPFNVRGRQPVSAEKGFDVSGIQNLNGTYKNGSIRKIDVLKKFKNTDIKENLTDVWVKYYIGEVSKIQKSPSLTLIVRVLQASKSVRVSRDMMKLPFWGFLSSEKYPGLLAAHIKPFIFPFLNIPVYQTENKARAIGSIMAGENKTKMEMLFSDSEKETPVFIAPTGAGDGTLVKDQSTSPVGDTKNFILEQIKQLGSIEAVNQFYSGKSSVDRHARRMALSAFPWESDSKPGIINANQKDMLSLRREIASLPDLRNDSSFSDPRFLNTRKLHNRAYEPWTGQEDELLPEQVSKNTKLDTLSQSFQFICLANSRKLSGHCIAGRKIKDGVLGEWVRPVSSRNTGELLFEEIIFPEGELPQPLDIVSLLLGERIFHPFQRENFLADITKPWKKVGEFPESDVPELCDKANSLWLNGYNSYNGLNDRFPVEFEKDKFGGSLLLIQPVHPVILVQEELDGKRKIRCQFSYNGEVYRLSVTDPFIEEAYLGKAQGKYSMKNSRTYFCISIGEPYRGFCYKLVAGVIGLKD